jgi:lipopolysaccharide cholinephosphotransferase
MTKEEFRKFQLAQIPLLLEIRRICDLHNLKYYLAAGTMLGAVRHGGFIPWDPDIDIIMPREDYQKFLKFCKIDLDSKYHLATYMNEKHHFNPHAKIYINKTVIVYSDVNYRKGLKDHPGIYIDIAPLDKAPKDSGEQKKQARKILFYGKIRYYKQGIIYSKGFFGWKAILKKIIKWTLLPIPLQWVNKKQDQEMQKFNTTDSELVCDMPSKYPYSRMVVDKSVYGNPTPIIYEGETFTGPENIDAYLKQYYGDYKKIPTEDQQTKIYDFYKEIIYVK